MNCICMADWTRGLAPMLTWYLCAYLNCLLIHGSLCHGFTRALLIMLTGTGLCRLMAIPLPVYTLIQS